MGKRELTITMRAKNALARGLGRARQSLQKFGSTVGTIGRGIGKIFRVATVGVMAFGAALAATVREGYRFKQGMAEVSTMLGDQQHLLKGMTDSVRIMAAEFGMAKDTLTKGLYDILSSGISAADAIGVLEVATKSAIGGVTDTATAVDALTTVLNAYDMEASEAGHVSDVLFQIVRDGKITFEELAENIGKLAPTAKAAGISLEDMGAIVASVVKVEKPERAMTAIRAAMMKMAESGEDLIDFVRRFKDADMGEIMDAGITRRAAVGVAILTGNVDALNGELDQFQDVAGVANEAFGRMNKYRQYGKLWQALKSTLSAVGETIHDQLAPTLEMLHEKWMDWAESGGIDTLMSKVKTMMDDLKTIVGILAQGGDAASEMWGALADVVVASFHRGAEMAVDTLKDAIPTIGKMLGAAAKVAWESLKPNFISTADRERVGKELGMEKEGRQTVGGYGYTEEVAAYTKEQKKQIDAQIRQNKLKEKYAELGIDAAKATKEETAGQQKLRLALENVNKKMTEAEEEANFLSKVRQGIHESEKDTKEDVLDVSEDTNDAEEDSLNTTKKKLAFEKQVAAEKKRALNEELKGIGKTRRMLEERAKMNVAQFIADRKADEEDKKREADIKDKRERLNEKIDRGIKLSRKDREWLDAVRGIEQAGQGADILRQREEAIKAELEQAQKDLAANTKKIKENTDALPKLLTY